MRSFSKRVKKYDDAILDTISEIQKLPKLEQELLKPVLKETIGRHEELKVYANKTEEIFADFNCFIGFYPAD